jgi:hypothetical protein
MRASNVLELSASRNCDRTIPATRATREFAFPTLRWCNSCIRIVLREQFLQISTSFSIFCSFAPLQIAASPEFFTTPEHATFHDRARLRFFNSSTLSAP